MLNNPKQNQIVKVWYNKKAAPYMPYHAKIGQVVIANKKGRPKNHGVIIDGVLVAIPGGQLNKVSL